MKIDAPSGVRDLGPVRCRPLLQQIAALPDPAWTEDPFRQQRFRVHRDTASIRLLWTAHEGWPAVQTVVLARYPDFAETLAPVFRAAAVRLDRPLTIVSAMLARLPAEASIPPHVDSAPLFGLCHRLHLPLTTNDAVDFSVDGTVHHLAAGQLYEIDNRRHHGVHNRGTTARIHLIFDAMPT